MRTRPSLSASTPALLGAGLLLLLAHDLPAQSNGSNFSLLHNGLDVAYFGLGAGTGASPADGLGTWVPGEDLKGSRQTVLGDWGHRTLGLVENACVLGPDPGAGGAVGQLAILFPNIALVELDDRNGHAPDVFLAPLCTPTGLPGLVSGVVPYGRPMTPGVATPSAAFLLAGYPSVLPGLPSSGLVLPNNGLLPSGHGGTATLIANTGLVGLPINSTGFCWTVTFNWLPSALPLRDDIDGLWHYVHTSPDMNQYWGLSNNELNAWQSQSVARVGGGLQAFTANLDYALVMTSPEPQTHDALQPAAAGGGVYYSTTAGASGGNPGAPGAGFDLGRHLAWSQSGTGGVPNPSTGLGNQDPLGGPFPTALPSLGFATFNNRPYTSGLPPAGGWRLTWVTLDLDASLGLDPALAGDATAFAGSVRVPSPIPSLGGWPQSVTAVLFPILVHDTAGFGWPNPYGAGGPVISGTSLHLPLSLGPICVGVPVVLAYGSSGLLGPSGPMTWSPDLNAASDARQLHLLD